MHEKANKISKIEYYNIYYNGIITTISNNDLCDDFHLSSLQILLESFRTPMLCSP